jgi:hypothetical protein
MKKLLLFFLISCPLVVPIGRQLFGCGNVRSGNGLNECGLGGIQVVGNLPSGVISQAIANWNGNCQSLNFFPNFTTASGTKARVEVNFEDTNAPSAGLGVWVPGGATGSVEMYHRDPSGRTFTTSELTYILTHELGHALGLDDTNGDCIMGPAEQGFFGGYQIKQVHSEDCSEANSVWRQAALENRGDGQQNDCINQNKMLGDCNSPLLIDLGRNRFRFGGPDDGVYFDLLASGVPIHTQWVLPNGDDAFLARDLNGNGRIDDGSELFGQGTLMVLAGVNARHGFQALAQFDKRVLGGNGDGRISRHDEVWEEILLWNDANADGISQSHELTPITQSPVARIFLDAKRRPHVDEHGNRLALWEQAFPNGVPNRPYWVVDVFFIELD